MCEWQTFASLISLYPFYKSQQTSVMIQNLSQKEVAQLLNNPYDFGYDGIVLLVLRYFI